MLARFRVSMRKKKNARATRWSKGWGPWGEGGGRRKTVSKKVKHQNGIKWAGEGAGRSGRNQQSVSDSEGR